MTRYIGQRLLQLIPVTLLVSFVSFGIIFLLPGDPALVILGDQGLIDKQMYEATRRELGLNDPIPIQYLNWLSRTVRGDLGISTRDHEPIARGLVARLPVTL